MPADLDPVEQGPPDDSAPREQVTRLLNAVAAGDPKAPNELFELVYDQLREIASKCMAAGRPGHTLQATARRAWVFARGWLRDLLESELG